MDANPERKRLLEDAASIHSIRTSKDSPTSTPTGSPPPPNLEDTLSNRPLCRHCQKIEFDEIFRTPYIAASTPSGIGYTICDLGYVKPGVTDCPLCQVFDRLMLYENGWDPQDDTGHLVVHSARRRFSRRLPQDVPILAVHSEWRKETEIVRSFLVPTGEPDTFAGRLIKDKIDWSIFKEWLAFCQDHHNGCVPTPRPRIGGLRVIDCQTRQIILVEESTPDYVALSYVWGQEKEDIGTQWVLPERLPLTIEDSFQAVLALGHQYLWVDRYCVPQEDGPEKIELIGNMGLVYETAILTLVAAAGESPNYGLPGVTSTRRHPQISLKLGSQSVLLINMYVEGNSIQKSKWNTRGWTYQEALLSRRKLVFTDQGVRFQCNGMYCSENLSLPLAALHTDDLVKFAADNKLPRSFPAQGVGTYPIDLEGRMREFSKRDLSYDYDSINAFLGIYQKFSKMSSSVKQLVGVPIFASRSFVPPRPDITERLVFGLNWEIGGTGSNGIRRRGVPSWTWHGWKIGIYNTLSLMNSIDNQKRPRYRGECTVNRISVEYPDGEVVPWADGYRYVFHQYRKDRRPTILHMHGYVFDAVWSKQHYVNPSLPQGYSTMHPGIHGQDTAGKIATACLICIYENSRINVLLLEKSEIGDDTYERAGSASIRCRDAEGTEATFLEAIKGLESANLRKMTVKIR